MFRRAPVIVKGDNPFGGTRQVGDDEADAGVQLAGMPFDLGNDTAFLVPRSGLIAEAGVIAPDMVRRTATRARQQMGNAPLENLIGFEADDVFVILGFQEFIKVRQGKGGIPSEIAAQVPFPVTLDDRFQNVAPTVGAMNIAGAQGTPLKVTELVEQEQPMVAGAVE